MIQHFSPSNLHLFALYKIIKKASASENKWIDFFRINPDWTRNLLFFNPRRTAPSPAEVTPYNKKRLAMVFTCVNNSFISFALVLSEGSVYGGNCREREKEKCPWPDTCANKCTHGTPKSCRRENALTTSHYTRIRMHIHPSAKPTQLFFHRHWNKL